MRRGPVVVVTLALHAGLAFACGAAGPAAGGAAALPAVLIGAQSAWAADVQVPFVALDPTQVRLAAAAQDLKGKIGHEVNVDLDPELQKEHADHLADALSDALEAISRGIDRARVQDPGETARAVATLASLRIELDERTRDPYVVYDAPSGALVLRVPTHATTFTADTSVAAALLAK